MSMKDTIIRAATAVICVIVLCITSSSAVTNYSNAVMQAAKLTGNTTAVGGTSTDTDESIPSDTPSDTTDDTVIDEITDDGEGLPTDEGTDTTAADDSSAVTTPDASAQKNDPTTYSKEQIVKYYTESMNKSYNHKNYDLKKTETIAISVNSITPGGQGAAKLANKIVEAYAKTNEETIAFSKGLAVHDGIYRADDFGVPVSLDPKGAKAASVTKKGNEYEINIQVVAETATLEKFPVYNRQCSFPLNLAAIDLFGLTVTQADFNYSGTTLKAYVGADGYVRQAEVYMPLSGKGGGNFIGIKGAAEVSGSMRRTLDFTYKK